MNPYEVLDVDKSATDKDIKKAYRKGALKHHPDKGGDSAKFKELTQAYEILSTQQKRQQYDNFGNINVDTNFDPSEIFNLFQKDFERMFNEDFFGHQHNHTFNGFLNQSDQFNGLNMFLCGIGGIGGFGTMANMGAMANMGSFSQSTIIQNGKKITTTIHNGNKTVTEEIINNHNSLT